MNSSTPINTTYFKDLTFMVAYKLRSATEKTTIFQDYLSMVAFELYYTAEESTFSPNLLLMVVSRLFQHIRKYQEQRTAGRARGKRKSLTGVRLFVTEMKGCCRSSGPASSTDRSEAEIEPPGGPGGKEKA